MRPQPRLDPRERIIPIPFESKSNHYNEKERIIIYPKANDIVLIEGDDNYSTIYFTDEYLETLDVIKQPNKLRVAKTLKYFEEKLRGYGCFFRCSRGNIVNLYHVRLLKYRTIYLDSIDKAVYLSADLVTGFKTAMDTI